MYMCLIIRIGLSESFAHYHKACLVVWIVAVLPYSSGLSLLNQAEPTSCLCSACRERASIRAPPTMHANLPGQSGLSQRGARRTSNTEKVQMAEESESQVPG